MYAGGVMGGEMVDALASVVPQPDGPCYKEYNCYHEAKAQQWEDAVGDSVARGGYVITTKTTNVVGQVTVDDQLLFRVAEILGIQEARSDQFISEIRSIHIYRGK
jgi:hypothetical protein